MKKHVLILCWPHRRIAAETQAKVELGPCLSTCNLDSLSSSIFCSFLPAFAFSFHSSQPTFFAICATLFVLSLSLPCLAFLLLSLHPPFCPYFPTSLQLLRLFDPPIFPPSLPALSLAGHPHFLQYARGWERKSARERQREGERKIYKYRKAKHSYNTQWAQHHFM